LKFKYPERVVIKLQRVQAWIDLGADEVLTTEEGRLMLIKSLHMQPNASKVKLAVTEIHVEGGVQGPRGR